MLYRYSPTIAQTHRGLHAEMVPDDGGQWVAAVVEQELRDRLRRAIEDADALRGEVGVLCEALAQARDMVE